MLSSGNKRSKVTILGSAILHYYCSNTSRRNLKFGITIGHKIWPILHQYMKQNSNLDPKEKKKTRHHQWWWQAHLWTKSDFPEEGRHWAYYNRVCLWRTEKQVRQSQKKSNHPDKCLSYKGEKAEMTKLKEISSGLFFISFRQYCSR